MYMWGLHGMHYEQTILDPKIINTIRLFQNKIFSSIIPKRTNNIPTCLCNYVYTFIDDPSKSTNSTNFYIIEP